MEDLRLAIIVLGAFAIVGVLVHGIWTIRKNNQKDSQDNADNEMDFRRTDYRSSDADHEYVKISIDDPLLSEEQSPSDSEFEEQDPLLGDQPLYAQSDLQTSVSETASSKSSTESAKEEKSQNSDVGHDVNKTAEHAPKRHQFDEDDIGEVRLVGRQSIEPKPESKSNPEPENNAVELPEPPSSLLKKEVEEGMKIDTSIEIDETPRKRSTAEPKVTTETKTVGGKKGGLAEKARRIVGRAEAAKKAEKDQIRLDLDEKIDVDGADEVAESEPASNEQEVLIISVRAPEGKAISGASLLPALLTLGFKFGEHNMFHRHANSNGKGPKLFSLANMFNPGTFDIDNMENFTTAGLSLFMILPIEADPHQVFNMMHNAARKLADEFELQILDGRRSALTKQSLQQYVEKIREFERRRMIKRA